MKTHSFFSHNAEEMRRLSNFGHLVEGLLLTAVGVLLLLNSVADVSWAAALWRWLALAAGVVLLLILYPLHPRSEWALIWRDPQQRQHTLIAFGLIGGGAAELLAADAAGSALAYVWPIVLLFIGALFMLHTQHGHGEALQEAVMRHRLLGGTIIVAGALRLLEIVTESETFDVLYALALLAAAIQLFLYREPVGAYEADSRHES